jgi:hypothetical protein
VGVGTLKKPVRRAAAKKRPAHGIKAVPGSLLAGLDHLIGCMALPPDSRPRREILRARYLADHDT